MNKEATPAITLIIMFMVAFFTIFLAVKQFFALREQVYQEAFYDINENK